MDASFDHLSQHSMTVKLVPMLVATYVILNILYYITYDFSFWKFFAKLYTFLSQTIVYVLYFLLMQIVATLSVAVGLILVVFIIIIKL